MDELILIIPASCTNLNEVIFESNITTVIVEEGNTVFASENGILYNFDKTTLIKCPTAFTGSLVIPNTVTTIAESAFEGCASITNVSLPSSLTTISNKAFFQCYGLIINSLPNSVTTIGDYAFQDDSTLTINSLPDSTITIGDYAFSGCSFITINSLPNSVTTIGDYAFQNCSNCFYDKVIKLSNSITSIGVGAFYSVGWQSETVSGIKRIISYNTTPPTIVNDSSFDFIKNEGVFDDNNLPIRNLGCFIYVPYDSVNLYKTNWSDYTAYITYIEEEGNITTEAVDIADVEMLVVSTLSTEPIITEEPLISKITFNLNISLSSTEIITEEPSLSNINCKQIYNLVSNSIGPEYCEVSFETINQTQTLDSTTIEAQAEISKPSIIKINEDSWKITYSISSPQTIQINFSDITNVNVYWNEGAVENYTANGIISHTYSTAGVYEVCIWGTASSVKFNQAGSNDKITSILITDTGITGSLDLSGSFEGCTKLTTITLPSNTTTIDGNTFLNCNSLTEILSRSSQFISNGGILESNNVLYKYPENKSGSIYTPPANITSIADNAFVNCEYLQLIDINSISVVTCGTNTFEGHNSSLSIAVPNDLYDDYVSDASWQTYKNLLSYEGTDASLFDFDSSTGTILGYRGIDPVTLLIPEYITVDSVPIKVVAIAENAFYNYSTLSYVILPDSIITIGNFAFGNTLLTYLNIPYSVEVIGEGILSGCSSTSITVDEGSNYFCSENGVLYNKTKSSLVYYPSYKVGTEFTIPATVTNICNFAFDSCNTLSTIYISQTVPPTVYDYTFTNNNLIIKVLYNSVAVYKSSWPLYENIIKPYYTNTNDFIVDENGYIVNYTGTETVELLIPDYKEDVQIVGIKSTAFTTNNDFTSIVVPYSIISIEVGSLSECTKLSLITVEEKNTYYSTVNGILFNKDKTKTITYPANKEETSYIITSDTIENYCFKNCKNLVSISNINNGGIGIFDGCSGLTSISISGTPIIGDYIFRNCSNLSSVSASGYTEIGTSAFEGTAFEYFEIPSTVTTIGNKAFYNCIKLDSILDKRMIPATLGTDAFTGCNSYLKIRVYSVAVADYKIAWSQYADLIKSFDRATLISILNDTDFINEFAEENIEAENFITKQVNVNKVVNGNSYVDLYVDNLVGLVNAEKIYFKKLNIKVK